MIKEQMSLVSKEIEQLLHMKQDWYGPNNIKNMGVQGVLSRMQDKFDRVQNMLKNGVDPTAEPLEDGWKDIAGYAIIQIILGRDKWK